MLRFILQHLELYKLKRLFLDSCSIEFACVVLWCFIFSIPFAYADDNEDVKQENKKYRTWMTPSPLEQIYFEGIDDQKGMSRIFVPAMTSSTSEPLYAVFENDELVGERNMGESFFVLPGTYTVMLGTGTIEQRIKKQVVVERGQTFIIEPDWCALTIEVIDESRSYVKQDMQIYRVETLENYGIIPAIDPELGEQLITLILEPGLYKIVERGADFSSIVNFTTVILEPGTYTPYTIVIDSKNGNFTGSGILVSATQLRQRKNLRLFGAAHGSVVLTAANDASTKKMRTNLNILSQLENRIIYEKLPHYYLSNNLAELGLFRQQGEDFLITQDRLQLKNTYVYYILKWLGGYARLEMTSHLFPMKQQFDTPQDVVFRDLDGNDHIRTGVSEVRLAPPLFPLGLKEGFGLNFTPLQTFKVRLNVRSGFGFRQVYNRNIYQQASGSDTLFVRIPDSHLRGLETSIVSNLTLLRNLAVTTDIDILFPIGEEDNEPVIDLENIFSLGLTRNVTIEHVLRLSSSPSYRWLLQEQFIQVRFSYFIF